MDRHQKHRPRLMECRRLRRLTRSLAEMQANTRATFSLVRAGRRSVAVKDVARNLPGAVRLSLKDSYAVVVNLTRLTASL